MKLAGGFILEMALKSSRQILVADAFFDSGLAFRGGFRALAPLLDCARREPVEAAAVSLVSVTVRLSGLTGTEHTSRLQ